MSARYRCMTLLLALWASPALAEKESPPVPGPSRPFRLPSTTEMSLPNGLQVTLVPYGDIPKADVTLVLQTGNVDEGRRETGLADLAGKLLLEGTAGRSAEQLAQAAADLGGALAVNVGPDESSVGIECLGEATSKAISLVADVVRSPALPEAELTRLKNDMVRELSIARSTQQSLASEAFARAVYSAAHPYGRELPDAQEVKGFNLASVKQFLATNVGANRAHLYVVGRYDEAAVRRAINEAFGGWGQAPGGVRSAAKPRMARAVYLVDRPGAVQSTVMVGLPAVSPTSPDYVALAVTNTLLGGSFGSRITANIREKHGYTYSPRSTVMAHPGAATWVEAADVTTKDTAAAVKEVLNEIQRLRKEAPSVEELASFQRYMSGTFVLQNSSRSGITGQLRRVQLYGLPADWLSTYVTRVNAVTPSEVTRVAKKYLDPARMVLVVVGDRKLVETSLKRFGKVTVVKEPATSTP